jgi:hypothetical protein
MNASGYEKLTAVKGLGVLSLGVWGSRIGYQPFRPILSALADNNNYILS